ncbi:er membrane protein [Ophiostoma piceae UAMH 11346]|uniref:Er membrane protein n=1 Tax=Ophiostoma piceae (strain UAMH 11346) TaxID=1262450 RepID=S3CZS6_OPHP1|nr:er membrane protein [Ophiostoma piceae UAMH 11346]
MSKFFEDLWESIFTPGPTPSLLIATNVSFFFLQIVLGALLVATYSVHFVVLSLLCAGLWWAINWFAHELALAEKEKGEREEEQKRKDRRRAVVAAATAVEDDSDTEVETDKKADEAADSEPTGKSTGARVGGARQRGKASAATVTAPAAPAAAERESTVVPETLTPDSQRSSNNSQRVSNRSGVSTEDEWEKVSENEEGESK